MYHLWDTFPGLSILIILIYTWIQGCHGDCDMLSFCSGHGKCVTSTSTCLCDDGWGSTTDISFYKSPDCSQRVCPVGRAWADVPSSSSTAHSFMECSNRGVCDRSKGTCKCFDGFTGSACQRMACPNDCSGHGVCVSLKQMARMSNALPLSWNTFYEGDEDGTTWDEDMIYGCVCDSSWTVGLGYGETQEPEWFGPDCSLRHCPSGDNPQTSTDETDCAGVYAKNSNAQGESGNLCQVDCSNQGICDYRTGTCRCFNGQYGPDCSFGDARAVYDYWVAEAMWTDMN